MVEIVPFGNLNFNFAHKEEGSVQSQHFQTGKDINLKKIKY